MTSVTAGKDCKDKPKAGEYVHEPTQARLEEIANHYGWNPIELGDAYYALIQTPQEELHR